MERSREIFLKIATASEKVITSSNDYARRRDKCGVSRSHFQLEDDMRKISVTCNCIANFLGESTPPGGRATCDDRLRDWLTTDEPQQCLDTLVRLQRLLQTDVSSWAPMSWIFESVWNTAPVEDKIEEAAKHFNSCKPRFHFLFSIEIWNKESGIQQQHDCVVQPESDAQKQPLFITRTGVTSAVSHSTNQQGGDANHIIQKDIGSISIDQDSLVPVQGDLDTSDIFVPQSRDTLDQGQKTVPHDQREKEENAEKLEEVIVWLDGLNCATKHDETLSLRQPDTCRWLLDTAEYKEWRDGENSFLWLRGKPGAGKSVLASSVVDSLENSLREGEILSFFYCDFRDERSTSSAEVLRSILSQLLRKLVITTPNLQSLLEDLVKAKERGGNTLKNPKELAGYICHVKAISSEKPLVVLDALDECKDIRILLEVVMKIKSHVRLFVTSRPLHAIMTDLLGLPFVSMDDMEDELLADIQLHVTRELDARHRLRGVSAEFKAEIRSALCKKAYGMFRWIQCSLDTLDKCVNRVEVRRALNSLPQGLDETYERILRTIDKTSGEGQQARQVLTWLVAALRPLSLDELMKGLSINLRTRTLDSNIEPIHHGTLLDVCGSLVTHSAKTGIIILSHFSVKEYLVGKLILSKLPQYHIDTERAHLQLAQSCMCYLSVYLSSFASFNSATHVHDDSSKFRDRLRLMLDPLRDYTLNHGIDHFRHLGSQFKHILHDVQLFANVIRRYYHLWDNLCRSTARYPYSITGWPISKHDLALYILVGYAPDSLLRVHLCRALLEPEEGTNPLIYTAHFDREDHARTLLSRGVRLNRGGWDIDGSLQVLPIEVALKKRHYNIAVFFIEEGNTVPPCIFTDSFLSPRDRIPSSLVKMLLQTDDFAQAANDPFNDTVSQPMHIFDCLLVTEDNYEDDLTAILRRYIQVFGHDFANSDQGKRVFHFAFQQGLYSVARFLLSRGSASLPSDLLVMCDRWDGWVVAKAAHFMVHNGANPRVRTPAGDPVLHIVLRSSRDEDDALKTVKAFIGYGGDPHATNSSGQTLLHIAVQLGFIVVTRYLFSLGISPSPDLLHAALESNNTKKMASMIICLLENRAIVHTRTRTSDPVLHTVLQSFWDEGNALKILKAFIDHGCDPHGKNSTGRNLLHVAVKRNFVFVTQYLFSLGISPSPDLLQVALRPRNKMRKMASMVMCLLENGVDARACTPAGDPVLHTAYYESTWDEGDALETMKAFITYGCDPRVTNSRGETLLRIAIQRGFVSVIRYLFSLGISPTSDLLHIAFVNNWHSRLKMAPITHCLLEHGVDVHVRNPAGDPVLHTALKSLSHDEDDALKTLRALITYGCDPHATNSSGKTLLHIAVQLGFVSVARYFLSLGISPSPDLLHVALKSNIEWNLKMASMIICLLEKRAIVHTRTRTRDPVLHTVLQSFWDEGNALNTLKALISHGCDPHETNSSGETLLHIAVKRSFVAITRYLFSLGAYPSPNLLHVALDSMWNITPMILCLLENGADVNARTLAGDSVLHAALGSIKFSNEGEALKIVKAFIGYGWNLHAMNSSGETLLHVVVKRNFVSVTRYLCSLGISPSPDLLHVALASPWISVPMILCLLENGADVHAFNSAGDPMLHAALKSESCYDEDDALKTVKTLISYGGDPHTTNSVGETLLHVAVKRGFVSATRYLLSLDNAPPAGDILYVAMNTIGAEHDWRTPVYQWLSCRDEWKPEMIIVLLENGARVYPRVPTGSPEPLLHAALRVLQNENKILKIMELLIDRGCDPLETTPSGETLLHIAVQRGFVPLMQFLFSLGISPSSDLLHVALQQSNERSKVASMITCLLENGVDVYARTPAGDSVLHTALRSSYDEHTILITARLLVSHGYDPLRASFRGNTLLHVAIERGLASVARYFLSLGIPFSPDLLLVTLRSENLNTASGKQKRLRLLHLLLDNFGRDQAGTTTGDPLVHVASQHGRIDDVLEVHNLQFLVADGYNPFEYDTHGKALLCIAVQRGRTRLTKYLLSLNPPSSSVSDALWAALCSKPFQQKHLLVKLLINQGASVLLKAQNGESVLHAAIASIGNNGAQVDEDEEEVWEEDEDEEDEGEDMEDMEVDVDEEEDEDDDDEDLRIVKLLLRQGCDPVMPNNVGVSPFHIAVERGRISIVKFFLSQKIQPPPDLLFTALGPSLSLSPDVRLKMIKVLVASGYQTRTRNAMGWTPLQVARRHIHQLKDREAQREGSTVTNQTRPLLTAVQGILRLEQ